MRSGNWRGVSLALGLACALMFVLGEPAPALADGFHTIPRLVEGVDVNTGGPYYAPPVPYGHYAGKNISGRLGAKARGLFSGLHGGGGLGGACGACGGAGCGLCGGGGLLGHGGHGGMADGCSTCGTAGPVASAQAPVMAPMPSEQTACGNAGCGLFGKGLHGHRRGCGLCGGGGCGSCATGLGGGVCGQCGGAGCGACAKARGMVNHLLGRDRIKWFTGPGGPVPLTPGYTPYINVTRSPRDFFAFPPMTP